MPVETSAWQIRERVFRSQIMKNGLTNIKKSIRKSKSITNQRAQAADKVFGELIEMMMDKPRSTTSAAHLLFVAKHIKRIGDYVRDARELNLYLMEAAFIKHKKSMKQIKKFKKVKSLPILFLFRRLVFISPIKCLYH